MIFIYTCALQCAVEINIINIELSISIPSALCSALWMRCVAQLPLGAADGCDR